VAEQAGGLRECVIMDAAGRSWTEPWPRVMQARVGLLAELLGVSEERAARQPGSGEDEDAWSIFQVMQRVLTYTTSRTSARSWR
jgi:hypothetical protein